MKTVRSTNCLKHKSCLATILVAMQLRLASQAWGQGRHAIPGRTDEPG